MPEVSHGARNIVRIFREGKKYSCKETAVYKITPIHVDNLFKFIQKLNDTPKGCGILFKYLIIPIVILILTTIILFVALASKLIPSVLLAISFVLLIVDIIIILKMEQRYQSRINQLIQEYQSIFRKVYIVTDDNGYTLRKEYETLEKRSNRYKIRIIPIEMTYEDDKFSEHDESSISDIGAELLNKRLKNIKDGHRKNSLADIETGLSADRFKDRLTMREEKKDDEEEKKD